MSPEENTQGKCQTEHENHAGEGKAGGEGCTGASRVECSGDSTESRRCSTIPLHHADADASHCCSAVGTAGVRAGTVLQRADGHGRTRSSHIGFGRGRSVPVPSGCCLRGPIYVQLIGRMPDDPWGSAGPVPLERGRRVC